MAIPAIPLLYTIAIDIASTVVVITDRPMICKRNSEGVNILVLVMVVMCWPVLYLPYLYSITVLELCKLVQCV